MLRIRRWLGAASGGRLPALGGVLLLLALGAAPARAAAGPEEQLTFAKGLFQQKLFSLAAPEFEKFLKANANHPQAASARFFLAHSYYGAKEWARRPPPGGCRNTYGQTADGRSPWASATSTSTNQQRPRRLTPTCC